MNFFVVVVFLVVHATCVHGLVFCWLFCCLCVCLLLVLCCVALCLMFLWLAPVCSEDITTPGIIVTQAGFGVELLDYIELC